VDPRWISVAVDALHAEPRIGIIGFEVIEPAPGSVIAMPALVPLGKVDNVRVVSSGVRGGMAMMVRSEVFERIGLIDEGFLRMAKKTTSRSAHAKLIHQSRATNVRYGITGGGSFGKIPLRASFCKHAVIFDF